MQDKKYLEYKVTDWKIEKGEFKIIRKDPTKRGHVMISERDAEINNLQTRFNKFHYELDKPVKKVKEEKPKE